MLKTEAIVLSEMRYKESSKILKIYSKEYGKLSLMVQGAYRAKSSLKASSQVFSYNEYMLRRGRSLYYLNQASLIDSFYPIREKIERFAYGSYILELVDKSTAEEEVNDKIFPLLLRSLQVLSELEEDFQKFSLAFGLKYISFLGYRPHLGSCLSCGDDPSQTMYFSHSLGGILCKKCSLEERQSIRISHELHLGLRDLLYTPLDKLAEIDLADKTLIDMEKLMNQYILHKIDRKELSSMKMIKQLV